MLMALVICAVFVLASVRLGLASLRFGTPGRLVVMGATAVLLFAFLVVADEAQDGGSSGSVYNQISGVTDLYPYDQDGKPITGVRLYDQNGVAVEVGDPWRCPQQHPTDADYAKRYQGGYPLCNPGAPIPAQIGPVLPPTPSSSGPPSAPATAGQSPGPSGAPTPSPTGQRSPAPTTS